MIWVDFYLRQVQWKNDVPHSDIAYSKRGRLNSTVAASNARFATFPRLVLGLRSQVCRAYRMRSRSTSRAAAPAIMVTLFGVKKGESAWPSIWLRKQNQPSRPAFCAGDLTIRAIRKPFHPAAAWSEARRSRPRRLAKGRAVPGRIRSLGSPPQG